MLDTQSALSTGSLCGIGRATARALAEMGCAVTLNGFAPSETVAARLAEIRDLSVHARYHPADLRQPDRSPA